MLAAVFYMQPVGQLVANVVTIIATSVSRQYISQNSDPSNCQGDCLETADKIWRWIVGLGAILPALAMLARLYIPESPRYLLEVEKDSHTAQQNAEVYFVDYEEDPFQEPDDEEHLEESQVAEQETAANNEPSNFEEIQMEEYPNQDNITIEEYHRADPLAQPSIGDPRMIPDNGPRSDSTLNVGWASTTSEPPFQKDGTVQEIHSLAPSDAGGKDITDLEKFQLPSPGLEPSGQPSAKNTGDSQPAPQGELRTRKASWREFWKGFGKFLFDRTSVDMTNIEGFNYPSDSDLNQDNNLNNVDQPPRSWTDGNWTDLAGTAFSWFLLDFSFYFLGVNSWKITAMVWNTPTYDSVYQFIIQLSWRTMISISLSSLIGGALFIAMARYRHNLQTYGFLILAAFFIALGATFVTILGGQYFAAIIVLYFFTQLFFDFGPNTSTFIVSHFATLMDFKRKKFTLLDTSRGIPDSVSSDLSWVIIPVLPCSFSCC
jgi:PHS family inorganic phosphate transporter-like MFS transporter